MNPPAKVKIGGQDWAVRMVKFDDDLSLYGRTKTREALIELANEQPATFLRDTMLHEILHACLSMLPNALADDVEEQVVRGVSPWLLAVLRDNKRLVEFLLAKD